MRNLQEVLSQLPDNTYAVLKRAAAQFPEKTAITFLPNGTEDDAAISISYNELLSRVNQTANLFLQFGITRNKTVSYVLPNNIDNYYVLMAAEAVGIANPISPALSPEIIADILYRADSELLVTVGFVPPIWQAVLAAKQYYHDHYQKKLTILVIGGHEQSENHIFDFNALMNAQSTLFADRDPAKKTDICAYFHSSGTTGKPKLAALTHQNKLFTMWAETQCFHITAQDVFLNAMPLFHVAAPVLMGLVVFSHGAHVVLMSPMGWLHPNVIPHFWKIVEKYQGTITAALPFVYTALLHSPFPEKNSLRLAISGSALSKNEMTAYRAQHPALWISTIYGATEYTNIVSYTPHNHMEQSDTLGVTLPFTHMRIAASSDSQVECRANEIGLIQVQSPIVCAGYKYAGKPVQNENESRWFDTGDLGVKTEAGSFRIVCRVSDIVNGSISSLEIENALREHPDIALVAVIGKPIDDDNEIPLACVQLKPNSTLSEAQLKIWYQNKFNNKSHDLEIRIETENLPVNGMGKVDKPQLREREKALYNALNQHPTFHM